jgi:peptidyl-prolyl cis-trans isomerase C
MVAGCATSPPSKRTESPTEVAAAPEPVDRAVNHPEEPNVPTTDDAIRARYDRMVKENSGQPEYRVAHILVATEADAASILVDLKSGKKFRDLAREKSKDGSAKNGGDLGWSVARVFPGDFSQAIRTMDKPGIYPYPVKTSYGWHVILVEEIRTYQPLPYDRFRQANEALMSNEKSR